MEDCRAAVELSGSLVRGVAPMGPEMEVRGWQEAICGLGEGWQGEPHFFRDHDFSTLILEATEWSHRPVGTKCGPTGIAH